MGVRSAILIAAATAALTVGAAAGQTRAVAAESLPARAATAAPAPVHLGSRGPRVRALQRRLSELTYLPAGAVDGVFGLRTWHAVVAFQGWQRLSRDGVVNSRTQAALSSASPPRPWVKLARGLELDTRRQVLLVVERGRTVHTVHVSTARPGFVTPRGRFSVYRRERMSWSAVYGVWMPYALYFSGGYAIHGFSSVPAYPASHGCVRVPLSEAPLVYALTPLHTPVIVR